MDWGDDEELEEWEDINEEDDDDDIWVSLDDQEDDEDIDDDF